MWVPCKDFHRIEPHIFGFDGEVGLDFALPYFQDVLGNVGYSKQNIFEFVVYFQYRFHRGRILQGQLDRFPLRADQFYFELC